MIPILYIAKFWFSSYWSKCCQSIKLQDSLKCNISRKKWMIKYIFNIYLNYIFYKLILSFWGCVTRHVQSIQNKKFAYLCNISKKSMGMKLIFFLKINMEVFYKWIVSIWLCLARHAGSTRSNKLAILCNMLRKISRVKLIFRLHINIKDFFKLILSFGVYPNYPN